MSVHAEHSGRSAPDFVPEGWLRQYGADAAGQVRASGLEASRQPQNIERQDSALRRSRAVYLASLLVAFVLAISIAWASVIGSAPVFWTVAGSWAVAGVVLSAWVILRDGSRVGPANGRPRWRDRKST